jgi:protein translocase SecG subunit
MDPEEIRKLLKRVGIIGGFFALAIVFCLLGWTAFLVGYAVLVGIAAVLAILLQSGKGGGLSTSLGGLGGDSLLGTHSATPIAKATYVMLGLLLFICMLVARMESTRQGAAGAAGGPRPIHELPMDTGD